MILAYHSISPKKSFGAPSISPHRFRKQIELALNLGFTFGTMDDYGDTDSRLYITFDDGFESVYRYAYPILQELGVQATVYVVAGYVGQYNSWDVNWFGQKHRHMHWQQLNELSENGWSIGSHGMSHRSIPALSQQEQIYEMAMSKALLQQNLPCDITSFSFPFGNTDSKNSNLLDRLGYRTGVVLAKRGGMHEFSAFILPRSGVYDFENITIFRQKILGKYIKLFKLLQEALYICSNGTVVVKRRHQASVSIFSSKCNR